MFLNFIKDYFLKRFIKNNFHNAKINSTLEKIVTIGLLVDEDCLPDKKSIIQELIAGGISENNISIIVLNEHIRKNDVFVYPNFNSNDINWRAEITNPMVTDFTNEKFDLLISYYVIEKAILLKITNNSKALFKVGFSSIDKRLNNLIINTNPEKYEVFIEELFRYLKILKKI